MDWHNYATFRADHTHTHTQTHTHTHTHTHTQTHTHTNTHITRVKIHVVICHAAYSKPLNGIYALRAFNKSSESPAALC